MLSCSRYVCLSVQPQPAVGASASRAEPVAIPQGAREEDDVVSEDLVEQDAKVRLVGGI